jgi:hypothetical protein
MQLPRFTSGEVGRLTFAHLNDLFARLEALEAAARNPLGGAGIRGRSITAKITGQPAGGVYTWVEVHRDGEAWVDKPDGLSSKDPSLDPPDDDKAFPIIGAITEPYPIPVAITPQYRKDGSLFYSPASPGEGGAAFYKIISYTTMEPNKSWQYTIKKQIVELVSNAPTWKNDPNSSNVVGLNGAENRTDPPFMTQTNDLYGVGWARPQGGLVQARNPIQPGIIVHAQPISGTGYYGFHAGNGYTTVCL